ncbi:MAG TPA: RNA 2',3'-cyclic phosphodiesterase [Bryobacteraceae bacterium]|nr:RNA 2',3'-cyclic phosphodiesterase [Bryobacteraceae bacterium]
MRLFTAIDLPEEVRDHLRSLVDRLKPLVRINWSPVANLHITTKFIGEWPENRLDEMKQALAAMPGGGAFEISVRGLGWFPNERRPRVFWAGVESGESLTKLARTTEQAVAALGVPVEGRIFSPHLTLARIREPAPLDAVRSALAKTAADFGSFRATEFFLYLSAGGKYTRLAAFSLYEKGDRPPYPSSQISGSPREPGRGQSCLSPFSTPS